MGGGGGSSGAVSHSVYLEWAHADWLNDGQLDSIEQSVTSVMSNALGGSPWTGLAAYNPAVPIAAYEAELAAFKVILAGIDDITDWSALFTQSEISLGTLPAVAVVDMVAAEITDAEIVADVTALSDQIDDEITTKVLPRFRRGMQDINAVVSSAFSIGEAIIEGFRNREVAKHNSGLRIAVANKNADIRLEVGKANLSKNIDIARINAYQGIEVKRMSLEGSSQMLNLLIHRMLWNEGFVRLAIEANRIKIVALKEQTDSDAAINEADTKWDLEVFQYGCNVLAAVSGGASMPASKGISKATSALGGAMTGAATGAMVGSAYPVVGTAVGAVVGGILGAAAGLLS